MLPLSRHGYYAIERMAYGIRLTLREGLNLEAVAEYGLDIAKHLLELEGRPWGMLLVVEHDALLTPEGGRRLQQTIQPQFAMGRCATAILLRECRAQALVTDFWGRIYQSANLPYQFFTQETEAQTWLEAQITQAHARVAHHAGAEESETPTTEEQASISAQKQIDNAHHKQV